VVQNRVSASCPAGQSIRAIDEDGTVTCELDDVGAAGTTYSAGTGLLLAGATFSVDASMVQTRIVGACMAGAAIRAINSDGSVVCDTDDVGMYGAGTGLVLVGSTFSVDPSAVQTRVLGTCAAGSSIRSIAADGSVTCEADDAGGTYTAGTGLTLAGTTFSVNTSIVQARVGGTCPAGQSIRSINADGTVICEVVSASGGVTFTRWGRADCPVGTSLVYTGYAAGASYNHGGSGGNTLCLTASPTWDNFSDVNQNGALIYGTEYEMSGYGLASVSPFNTLNDQNAPCAVCLDDAAQAQVMIPGTQTCPAGWNARVQGYLMSTQYQQAKAESVCVDRNSTAIAGGGANENGNLWYPMEAECGALPCGAGRYVQDREVTCSICTR
jgi:hypothetical protein